MNKDEFIKNLEKLNLEYSDRELELLEKYYEELVAYNAHTNLTTITKQEDVYLKHFYDSLTIAYIIDLNNYESLLDIGSGAGFPGIVLKIFYPNLNVTLIDSNNKKIKFLKLLTQKLGLEKIEVIHDRVENFTKNNLNSYDIVTARAVTNLPVLTQLAMPLVKKDGYFIAMKGIMNEELQNSYYPIEYMRGKIISIKEFELPENAGMRTLLKIQKCENTLPSELRSYDKIIKKPLQKQCK